MIKKLGLVVFGVISIALIYKGVAFDEPEMFKIGLLLLAINIVFIVSVKLFPKYWDSKESGDAAKKVLKEAAKRSIGKID